ncbi:hypothetical protein [Granulicella tundricola]|uniref:Uncharacterized protein n=1 Tax=Granulicella tundricola (strain ATCC BAA-1859 / DSM 23138 / MP5ACTX9) TaxID=1198114 RepID=E8X3V0_GRATM|nr:hypothetical protein [Granulicella tundricola]ADW69378.1 hypothetical protein AciX9_2341 [Granulicella tundricola MP5ACTX9]
MKLVNGTETIPTFLDQATIALMQLSIDHLELLEQLAMELQARTSTSIRLPETTKSLAVQVAIQAATEYPTDGSTERTWDH